MFSKKCFDGEYSTQFLKEVDYLYEKGIKYSFVKTDVNGVRTYKYTKTSDLFLQLAKFYK